MAHAGFVAGPTDYRTGIIFSLRAALPGIEGAGKLTATGELVEIGLALFGPILFALAVLALRGRVKR